MKKSFNELTTQTFDVEKEIQKQRLVLANIKSYDEIPNSESIGFMAYWKKDEGGEDVGKQKLIQYVFRCFKKTMIVLNLKEGFSDDSAIYWAKNFVDEKKFLGLKLIDVNNFFKLIYNGHFGKVYGQLDAITLNLWADEYKENRLLHIENKKILDHNQNKMNEVKLLPKTDEFSDTQRLSSITNAIIKNMDNE